MDYFDPVKFLENAKAIAAQVAPLMGVLAFFAGLVFIGRGGHIMVMGRDGRGAQDDVPMGQVVANILLGACLVQFARSIRNTQELLAFSGSNVREGIAYMAQGTGAGSAFYTLALNTAMAWVGAIGVVAVFRGLLLWREMGSGANRGGGDDLFWRGLWHILGGGICVNIGFG